MRNRAARGLILLLDENLSGHRISEGLKAEGIPARLQTEIMGRGVSDEEVLKTLSEFPEYFLISKDSDFHKKPMVKTALIRHGIGAFVITSHKGKTADVLVKIIVRAWPRIQKYVNHHPRPFVAKIMVDGRVLTA